MTARTIAAFVALMFAHLSAFADPIATAMPTAAAAAPRLIVRVYDGTRMADADRTRAIESAQAILQQADVAVEWRDCARKESGCDGAPLRAEEVMVRLVRLPGRGDAARLGEALLDADTGRGTLATVFVDRVEALAAGGPGDVRTMTGRVIAHEVGHLLLGTDSHSDSGLMRGRWTLEDLIANRPDDWRLSGDQRALMRSRLGIADAATLQ